MTRGGRVLASPHLVTFDLFSALLDSRTGASRALQRIASRHGWEVDGALLYEHWDRLNKQAQRDCTTWVPYARLAQEALALSYARLGLDGDAAADAAELLDSIPGWPLWPDVQEGLRQVRAVVRVGVLSNVDDAIFRRTQAAALLDVELALTSERLQAYKPSAALYQRAARAAGGRIVHVATSARDVRGALEAGIPVVRLRRPGHHLDPGGPMPSVTVDRIAELHEVLPGVLQQNADE